MRVTFLVPHHGGLYFGGAEVQALRTAEWLQKMGVQVEWLLPFTRQLGQILHAFGCYPHYHLIFKYAGIHEVPIVLSPIFYRDISSFWKRLRYLLYLKTPLRSRSLRKIATLIRKANRVLPNTHAEAQQIQELFRVPNSKIRVVPNGVDLRFADADPRLFKEYVGIKEPFVLCVGRIEPRKNQERLIRALKGTGLRLILIGDPASKEYYERCRSLADDKVAFVPSIPHDDPLLASAYAACRVFALPSLLETPGIAALEAGVAGARIVITRYGGPQEYFGEFAHYVEPRSIESIRRAIMSAWESEADIESQRRHLTEN